MTLKKDLKLASFDASGPECLLQLERMLEVMDRLRVKIYPNEPDRIMLPCEYFDLMGGSGTGGLIALFLARLRMSAEEAISELAHIVEKVYLDGQLTAEDQTSLLKTSIENVLRKRGVPIDLKLKAEEDDDKCGGFVLASPRVGLGDILCLRTYDVKRHPSSTITVVDAALATCALHQLGSSTLLDQGQGYMGPGLEGSNPVRAVLYEASLRYGGDSSITALLSIGAGGHIHASDSLLDQKILPASLEAALAHNEEVAQQMHGLLDKIGFYYRFPGCQKNDGIHPSDADATMGRCVESLMAEDGAISLGLLYEIGGMKELYNEPPIIPIQSGSREDPRCRLRMAIEQEYSGRKVIIVSGKPGCGKTQLVRRLLEDYRTSRFRHIVWFNATSETSIRSDKVKQAIAISVRTKKGLPVNPLESAANWLAVYSSANDPDLDLAPLFPAGNGVIVVTTANELLSSLASEPHFHIKLDTMSGMEAVDMIHRSAKRESSSSEDRIAAAAIAEKLQHLPLALAQAASFISESACTNGEYLALLEQHLSQSAGQQDPVSTTCAISFQRLSRKTQRFLQLLSMLEFSNFPLATIPHAAKYRFRHDPISLVERGQELEASVRLLGEIFLCDGGWSDLAISEMAVTLEKYSLASFTLTSDTILARIHSLVRSWVFTQIVVDERVAFRDAACRLVSISMGEPRLEWHLPAHIDALMRLGRLGPIHLNELAAFGKILVNLNLRQGAGPWTEVYTRLREIHGSQTLQVATAALGLGATYDDQTLDQMEKFETEAVAIREALLGRQHLHTLRAKRELAGTFHRQRRMGESVQLCEEILRGLKLQLSPDDPSVLATMCWLALYRMDRAMNMKEAYGRDDTTELWSQLLEGNRSYYGRTHPKTLRAIKMSAAAATVRGSYADAEKLYLEMVEIYSKQLGETDHGILPCMHSLGWTYEMQGKYAECEHPLTKVVEILKQELGSTHTETLSKMVCLADFYEEQKRYSEAENLRLNILVTRKETVGEEDALTIQSKGELANNYYKQDRDAEATKLQEKVLEQYEASLGSTHTMTIGAMTMLSRTYQKQGRLADAEYLRLRQIKGWEAQPGPVNRNLFTAMNSLAQTYASQGRHSEAEALQVRVVESDRADLGDSDPHTVGAMHNLACTYDALGRPADAANLWAMVLKACETSLGDKHAQTKDAFAALLSSYAEMSALNAVAGIKQHFGEKKLLRIALGLMSKLIIIHCKRNKWPDAAIVQTELVKTCTDAGLTLVAAKASITLAKFYYKTDRLDEAEKLAMEAARVMWRLKGGNDPQYQETIALLEKIRQPTFSSALQWIKRSFS